MKSRAKTISKWTGLGTMAAGTLGAACAVNAPEGYDNYEEVETLSQSIIIGANDLIPVSADGGNVPARYRGLLDAVGRGVNNGALCTATHVGGGIVISAGHCFSATDQRVDNTSCAGAYVEFGYRNGKASSRSNCTTMLSKRTGGGYDYAIYRVSPVPAQSLGVQLDPAPGAGQPLTIFSHPGGRPLEWSQTCSVASTTGSEFRYQCDTQGGSSGASVLRDDTLQIVGIHWGGGGEHNVATSLSATPLREFLAPAPTGGARFVSRHSNKCLDVNANGSADGTNIQQWNCNGSGAQAFRIEALAGGQSRIVHTASGKCVDINAASTADGANVQLWACNGTGAQAFRIEDVGGGYVRIVNVNSGRALDVAEFGTQDGANVQQWGYAGSQNQQWRIEGGCTGISVHEHGSYAGYGVTLAAGDYPLSALLGRGVKNDDVTSVRVPAGCSLTAFEHDNFAGASLVIGADNPNLGGAGWNDRLSSLRVR